MTTNPADLTISDIIARKERARHALAKQSFWAKVATVEQMRGQLDMFAANRARNKAARALKNHAVA